MTVPFHIPSSNVWMIQFFHILINLEKAMAPHSSTLVWKIPWMEEPGRLQSMGSLRVGHDWATSLSLFTFMHWRRRWQPTPVFLPGESQGRGILVGCHLWGRTESEKTEVTQQHIIFSNIDFLFQEIIESGWFKDLEKSRMVWNKSPANYIQVIGSFMY